MSQYYVSIDGNTYGPATIDELKEWRKGGTFSEKDFVWSDAESAWKQASAIPELASVFVEPESGVAGVDDPDEIQASAKPAAKVEVDDPKAIVYCENHISHQATFKCPSCGRELCDRCRSPEDSNESCIDCYSVEKTKEVGTKKRNMLVIGAVLLIVVAMISSYIFFGPKAVEQPAEPERIELKLGSAPRLDLEGLLPEEFETISADMLTLSNAWKAALADTSFRDIPETERIAAMTEKGYLATAVNPLRNDLFFKFLPNEPKLELWLKEAGDSRCIFIADGDTVISARKAGAAAPQPR